MFKIDTSIITSQSCSQFEIDFLFKEFALYFFRNRLNNSIDSLLVLLHHYLQQLIKIFNNKTF
jgi:hypothetical protein